jgi:hypothetical protein
LTQKETAPVDESVTPGDEVEHWLPVPHWEGFYEVSDKSRVRSVSRMIDVCDGRKRRWPGRVLRPWPDRSGYPSVRMQAGDRRESVAVHMLVQRAFGITTLVGAVPDAGEPERWLPVAEYEGLYEVSDLGRIRSLHGGKGKGKRGGLLHPAVWGETNIHLRVILHKDREQETRTVHSLVVEAFVGPRPEGLIVCHGPGGVLDNRLTNLSHGTYSKNGGEDRLRDGTLIRGEEIKNSLLTEEIVLNCRGRYLAGEPSVTLAAEFGVNQGTMMDALTGRTWDWIPSAVPKWHRGTSRKGIDTRAAKLTPEQVAEIRRRGAAGEHQHVIAADFGVSQSTVWRALRGKTWTA